VMPYLLAFYRLSDLIVALILGLAVCDATNGRRGPFKQEIKRILALSSEAENKYLFSVEFVQFHANTVSHFPVFEKEKREIGPSSEPL